MRIFDTIENNQQLRALDRLVQIRVSSLRAERHNTLMCGAIRDPVQRLAWLESQSHRPLSRQIDDFLETRARGAARDQYSVEGPAGAQCFANRMESRHDLSAELRSGAGLLRRNSFGGMFRNSSVEKYRELLNGLLEWRGMPEPAMGEHRPEIPDKLYFRIGEVSRLAGIKPYVLRFWETEFSSLGPKKSGKGHRLYRRKDVELVLEIKLLLYEKRYTIEGARKYLESRSRDAAAKPGAVKAARPQPDLFADAAPALDAIRKELSEILQLLR